MSLENGSQLGIYTIVGPLGAGGMGEVYRATDSKLDREVAIKVLPDAMAYDKERVARFEREARVLAQLNHPKIAAIYGFDEAEGKRFLVLELVEGPTLADRLALGRLPVEECLDIARQIAEALEVAHDKGIIHRDLKPANVKVTVEGEVKVLDFGLAKALAEEDTSLDPTSSPTITQDFTAPGVILGTAAYMSPEQARGRPVDKRSDIWSFGCVLFECLTGDPIFRGETVTDSIGAILHKQPDWNLLPAETPPTVRLLLRRCLAKDRKRRIRDIGDVRIELEAAIADPASSDLGLSSAAIAASGKASIFNASGFASIMGTVLLTAAVAFGIALSIWPKPPEPSVQPPSPAERYTYTLPHREIMASPGEFSSIDVSRDGSILAYQVRSASGGEELFLRRRGDPVPQQIATTTTNQIRFPTLSPDGEWCAYYAREQRKVLKRPVLGGPTRTLCQDAYDLDGLAWSPTGDFLVMADNSKPDMLLRVGKNGGKVEEIKLPHDENTWIRFVHVLPAGKAVLYVAFSKRFGRSPGKIRVYSFETGEIKDLIAEGSFPLYAASGHLLYIYDSTLMAAPFDIDTLELTGAAVPAVEEVWQGQFGWAQIAISDEGTLFHRRGNFRQENELKSIYTRHLDGDARAETISSKTGAYNALAIAPPDGRYIAIEETDRVGGLNEEGTTRILVLDRLRDVATKLESEHANQSSPVFSPDGVWIYYSAHDEERNWMGTYRRRRDNGGETQLIYDGPRPFTPSSTTPDGQSLLGEEYSEELSPGTGTDLAVIHLGEAGEQAKRTLLYNGAGNQKSPSVSPDGRWVAFSSNHEELSPRVYVMPLNGEDPPYKVSDRFGSSPFWSPDGETLYFQTVSNSTWYLMAAKVDRDANNDGQQQSTNFEVGEVREVLEAQPGRSKGFRILPDGKSILEIVEERKGGNAEEAEEPANVPGVFYVTRNFFTELERLAPTTSAANRKTTEQDSSK